MALQNDAEWLILHMAMVNLVQVICMIHFSMMDVEANQSSNKATNRGPRLQHSISFILAKA